MAAKVKLPQCSRVNSHGGGGGGARGRPLRLLSRAAPRRAAAAADPRSPLSWGAERPAGEGRDGRAGGRAAAAGPGDTAVPPCPRPQAALEAAASRQIKKEGLVQLQQMKIHW